DLLPQEQYFAHSQLLVFRDPVHNVDQVRVIGRPRHLQLHVSVQVSKVQISRQDVASIVLQFARRERASRPNFEPGLRSKLIERQMTISFDLEFSNQGLWTLLDLEQHIDLRFMVFYLGNNFYFFKAAVAVESLNILDAVLQQLVAELPVREESVFLDLHIPGKLFCADVVVARKIQFLHFMTMPFVHLVYDGNQGRGSLEGSGDPDIEVPLALKIGAQVFPAFLHQFAVNGAL